MAGERTLPGLGLTGDWDEGSSGWKPGMDLNLLKLSVLTQLTVLGRVASVPGSPTEGMVYIVTAGAEAGNIAVYDEGEWVYIEPSAGWQAYDQETEEHLIFKLAWEVLVVEGGGGGDPGGGDGGEPVTYHGARILLDGLVTATAAWTTIDGSTVSYDTDGFTDAGNPERLVIPAGVSRIRLFAVVQANSDDAMHEQNQFVFYKNGTDQLGNSQGGPRGTVVITYTNNGTTLVSGMLEVEEGDYFDVRLWTAQSAQVDGWFEVEVLEGDVLGIVGGGGSSGPTTAVLYYDETLEAPSVLEEYTTIDIPEGVYDTEIVISIPANVTSNASFRINDSSAAEYDYQRSHFDAATTGGSSYDGNASFSALFSSTLSDDNYQVMFIRLYQPEPTGPIFFEVRTSAGAGVTGWSKGVFRNSAGEALSSFQAGAFFGDVWPVGTRIEARDLRQIGGGSGGGTGTDRIFIGTAYLTHEASDSTGSTSEYAAKGNRYRATQTMKIAAASATVMPSAAGETYQIVVAKLVGETEEVEEVLGRTEPYVTSATDAGDRVRLLSKFIDDARPELAVDARYVFIVVRTEAGPTGICRVPFPAGEPEEPIPGLRFLGGVRDAVDDVQVGSMFSDQGWWTTIGVYTELVDLAQFEGGGGGGGGGIEEAPEDGTPYVRQDAAWVEAPGGEVEEAPGDGNLYARKDGAWLAFMDAEGIPVAPYGGARIRPSAIQNYTVVGAYDQLRFDTADRDTHDFWTDTAPNRLTIPAGVTKVRLAASLKVESADSIGSNTFLFGKNGTVQDLPGAANTQLGTEGYGNPGVSMISDVLDVEEGDYFEVFYYGSESFSLNADRYLTWFALEVVERTFATGGMNANFGDLLDVDMETVAPADGDIAIWSEAEGKWLPGTPSVLVPEAQTFEKPFKGAMAIFSANKGLAAPTFPVLWDDVDYDTDDFWSAASPGRFTVPAGVTMVRLHATLDFVSGSFTGTNGQSTILQFGKNGSTNFRGSAINSPRSGYSDSGFNVASPPIPVVEGDYFELRWNTSQSGTLTAKAGTSLFSIEVLETEEVV